MEFVFKAVVIVYIWLIGYKIMTDIFILIAEDDADDRYLIKAAFAEKGNTDKIEFVENGIELFTYLESVNKAQTSLKEFPGFILLDLNMPKKDGREVLKEIKQHPVYKKIPVIIFSTTKSEMEIKHCYELGANTYIVKPHSFDLLIKVVHQIRNYWFEIASIPV